MFKVPTTIIDESYRDYLACYFGTTNEDDPQHTTSLNSIKRDGNLGSETNNTTGENIEDVPYNSLSPEVAGTLSENQRKTTVETGMKFDSSGPIEVEQHQVEEFDGVSSFESSQRGIDIQGGSAADGNDVMYAKTSQRRKLEDATEKYVLDPDFEIYRRTVVTNEDGEKRPKYPVHTWSYVGDGDDNHIWIDGPTQERYSSFREELVRVLEKPFDVNELHKLAAEMTASKPVGRHMDLPNGREKFCLTNKDGKSYLDHYPDLRREVEAADCYKKLTLFRGFFFWLMNVAHEGVFRPWEDKACLALRPKHI